MTTDPLSDRLKRLPTDLKLILEKRFDLFVLELGERIGATAGKLVVAILMVILMAFGILFVLLALAMFLGSVLRNPAGGYALVGVFLFVFAFFCWLLLPGLIERKVRRRVVETLIQPEPTAESVPTDATP